jgi:serine/threonine-protein kinase
LISSLAISILILKKEKKISTGMPGMIGRLIGQYRVVSTLYTGKYSRIYKGVEDRTFKEVAIKVLLPEAKSAKRLKALENEARWGQEFSHPHLLEIYSYEDNEIGPHFVMEFFPSRNLRERILHKEPLVQEKAKQIVTAVAEALAYVHRQGVIHRDVKPSNILVSDQAEAKLIDFSIAEPMGTKHRRFLFKPRVEGTPAYMAPEQIRGEALDGRCDIYALGATIYEMMTGHPPFTADAEQKIVRKHLVTQVPSMVQRNMAVSEDLDRLVKRMLSKNREDRPPRMEAVLKRLHDITFYQEMS